MTMKEITRRMLSAGALAVLFAVRSAAAQAPQRVRVRARIQSVNGSLLDAKERGGAEIKIRLADNAPVNEVIKARPGDIQQGSYIAVTGMPQPDGSQKAAAILIFPPAVHPAEGFNPWDYSPNSTMTNATVASKVSSIQADTLVVKYKGGEQKIIVLPATEVVTYKKTSAADLKAGQKIFVFAAKKLPDGTLEAPNVSFGDYGVWR
jgi:hypothetical protein